MLLMRPRTKIRIVLADDHKILRAGLRLLIDSQTDMRVIGEASSGVDVASKIQDLEPDVVLVEPAMPGFGGMEAIVRCRGECPRSRVLICTVHDSQHHLRAAVDASAAGFVGKSASETELLAAIRMVHKGFCYFSAALEVPGAPSVDMLSPPSDAPARMSSPTPVPPISGKPASDMSIEILSCREQQVLEHIVWGYTNREIARFLGISAKTVDTYRGRLCEKLGMRTRAELIRYAVHMGLLGADR